MYDVLTFAPYIFMSGMSLQGYRAHMGVGMAQSCEASLAYYQKSAEEGEGLGMCVNGSSLCVTVTLCFSYKEDLADIWGRGHQQSPAHG